MKIKISLIFTVLILIFGCKESVSQNATTNERYTITKTKNDGGKFSSLERNELDELLDSFYRETSKNLDIEKKSILLFDVFKNNTNYIWYAADQKTDSFFRFISDLKIEKVNFEEIEKSIIKKELNSLGEK
ncbi:hypothetical protein ATO12_00335 [Aquimarina atlantica]|uniref:Lipoprotein n=1 Tax=Aquimarina atlantica TaxID=1317122 RepID=A0A023BYU2_9FLAO|nr:hypothetical protein [Aquimarina atlantica]EZH75257.1 hypothetical protein ATO12_00335 [Aquimarina atlantica]